MWNKIKLIFALIIITLLMMYSTVFIYYKYFQQAKRVFVYIPKDYEGRFIIYFNKSGYPPLPKNNRGYSAYLKNGLLNTSTSFTDIGTIPFYLYIVRKENNKYIKDAANNYAFWYSRRPKKTLINEFKNEEVYVGYFYKNDSISSLQSITKFVSEIGGDTLLINDFPYPPSIK